MKPLLIAAAALAAATPAFAQADPVCDWLDKALAATAETPLPWASFGPDGKVPLNQKGEPVSFFDLKPRPAGFEDADRCTIWYGAGAQPHRFECRLVDLDEDEDPTGLKARKAAEAMTAKVKTCLAPKGWTAAAPKSTGGGRERGTEWVFSKETSAIDVQVTESTFVYGRGQVTTDQYSSSVNVRLKKPGN